MASEGVENGDDKKIGTRYSQLFTYIYLVTSFNYEYICIELFCVVFSRKAVRMARYRASYYCIEMVGLH